MLTPTKPLIQELQHILGMEPQLVHTQLRPLLPLTQLNPLLTYTDLVVLLVNVGALQERQLEQEQQLQHLLLKHSILEV